MPVPIKSHIQKGLSLTTPVSICALLLLFFSSPHETKAAESKHAAPVTGKIAGYRGIWFDLGQKSEYGSKYSGGLGTYTAKHCPLTIYSKEVHKTFFVFGGTTQASETHLLAMIGYYDHKNGQVPQPTVVHDKLKVNDPHDNPSIAMDPEGYLWVFVSGRGRHRPGYKYRSRRPYDIAAFDQISEEEFTYPQPPNASINPRIALHHTLCASGPDTGRV